MSRPVSGRVDQILKALDSVCSTWKDEELQLLATQSKQAVTKLRNVLKRTQVEQVAKLVQSKDWSKATLALKHHFPKATLGPFEEILVFVGDDLDGLTSAIKWVGQLDVQLKIKAFEALYEQVKFKGFSEKPQVLLPLWRRTRELPAGVLVDVRTHLDADRCRLVECIVQGVKQKDYSLCKLIHLIDESDDYLNEMMGAVVLRFELVGVDVTLLLIHFSMKLPPFLSL
jgi:hypothetical protein